MVKVTGADAIVGFDTVTVAVPGKAVSAAEIAAVNCVALTKVVARGVPFQLTTEAATKFVPFTTRVNPDAPQYGIEATGVEDGEIEVEVIVGGGGGCAPIVKFTRFDTSVVVVAVVPEDPETAEPGIWTATGTVPVEVKSAAGTVAVTCVLFTNVVVSWT